MKALNRTVDSNPTHDNQAPRPAVEPTLPLGRGEPSGWLSFLAAAPGRMAIRCQSVSGGGRGAFRLLRRNDAGCCWWNQPAVRHHRAAKTVLRGASLETKGSWPSARSPHPFVRRPILRRSRGSHRVAFSGHVLLRPRFFSDFRVERSYTPDFRRAAVEASSASPLNAEGIERSA